MTQTAGQNDSLSLPKTGIRNSWVFAILWLLTFVIYLPAAKAGWVIDAAGWLHNIRSLSFWHYINNSQSGINSLYQFTQFTTYIFYRLFNANPYAWHTLQVTMHVVNAFLVYLLCSRLFRDSGIKNGKNIALWGVALYTVCPHISEVIVWEASFHYLQGFMLILAILLCVQQFQYRQQIKYAWVAGIVFFCSTYSLEIFYLTPWFVLTLALYYRMALGYDKRIFKKTLLWFFVPQLIMFALHIVVLLTVYGGHFAHIAENVVKPISVYLNRPPRYVFHIFFFGRFFSFETRHYVYKLVSSTKGLMLFYTLFILVCGYLISQIKRMGMKGKAGVLLFVWVIICMVILLPIEFPEMLLVFYDRYTYFLDAFIYMLLALLVSYIPHQKISLFFVTVYGIINLYFTVQLNLQWKRSTYVDNRLLNELPDPGNKTVILLNIPENMNGIPMIGAQPDGEYKMMLELFTNKHLPNKIYDAQSFNMVTKEDGAHVNVMNDSVIQVTLNQWGTWWWYEGHGGRGYENDDYKLNMADIGHWYKITLKHPADNYLLLFEAGSAWKTVDMSKKNVEQD